MTSIDRLSQMDALASDGLDIAVTSPHGTTGWQALLSLVGDGDSMASAIEAVASQVTRAAARLAESAHDAPGAANRQQIAAAMLGHLLTFPMPEEGRVYSWDIAYRGEITGHIGGDLDQTRRAFHLWANLIDDAAWALRPHGKGPAKHVSLTGVFRSVPVTLWNLLSIPDAVTAEELSAPPQVDEPAEQVLAAVERAADLADAENAGGAA